MSNEFMREERYIVFKTSNLGNSLKGDEIIGGWRYAMKERKPGRIMARLTGRCGKEGRFWEAKS